MHSLTEVIKESKEAIMLIITWLWWTFAYIINIQRKWTKLSGKQFLQHIYLCCFVWFVVSMICSWIWITWSAQWVIIALSTYFWIKIYDWLDLIKAGDIKNIFLDYFKYKLWVQSKDKK